ncbi:hypothetical protein ACFE04_020121 [Oxalis oulophora]
MEAVVLSSFTMLRSIPTSLPFNDQPRFNLYNKKGKGLPPLTFSSIQSEGNGKGEVPRKVPDAKRAAKPKAPDANTINASNQREILALFRRIQTSISRGTSAEAKSISNLARKNISLEPILESIQLKDRTSDMDKGKAISKRRVLPKKEQDNPPVEELNSSRPPSNFVKQSPVQSGLASRRSIAKPSGEVSAETPIKEESQLLDIGKMKLVELKEVAKSRGIKGYSRMKKRDLVELLRS